MSSVQKVAIRRISSKYAGYLLNRGFPILLVIFESLFLYLDIVGQNFGRFLAGLFVITPLVIYFQRNKILDEALLTETEFIGIRFGKREVFPLAFITDAQFKKPMDSTELGLVSIYIKKRKISFYPEIYSHLIGPPVFTEIEAFVNKIKNK